MKHLFIINPAAGKHDQTERYTSAIQEACRELDYEITVSQAPGHCAALARDAAQTGNPVRIYACGGDGTLNEVINGIAGFSNVSVTHFCGGSGNDFVRIFSDPSAFTQLPRLLDCEEAEFDLIQCGERYAMNICSVGFDARIGTAISKYKRLPLVTGSGAYVLSAAVNLIRGVHEHYTVTLDDTVFDGEHTLVCIANGRWYGGGFHPTPDAQPDDGLLDVLLVKSVTRRKVAQVIGLYKDGKATQMPDLVHFQRCRNVRIDCQNVVPVNLDGELLLQQHSTFTVSPHRIRFCYPRGLHW